MDGLPPEGLALWSHLRSPTLQLLLRILAVLANRISGIPLIGYFDDFGALAPTNVGRYALRTFERFCNSLWITL